MADSDRSTIAKEVKDLIRDMSRANPTWDSPRNVAELRKLGIEVAEVDGLHHHDERYQVA